MHVSIGLPSCKCEYMFLSVYVCLCVYLDMCIYVQFYPFVCQNMRMYAFISLSVYTCACRYVSIPGFLLVCLSVCLSVYAMHMYVCFISLSAHAHSCFYQCFYLSGYAHVCAKVSVNAPINFVVSRGSCLLLGLHLTLCV